MKHLFTIPCYLFVLILIITTPQIAFADHSANRKTEAISQYVYNSLKATQTLVDSKQYIKALNSLKKLREDNLSKYEASQSWNLEAYIYYLQDDYDKSISAYNEVLKYKALPQGILQGTLRTITQLYISQEKYEPALKSINRLIHLIDKPAASNFVLKGQIYYQMNQYNQSIAPIEYGIELHEAQGKIAKENWLLMLQANYHEQQAYAKMIPVLDKLITHYGKNQYVLTQAGIYGQLGNTEKQLSLLQALYENGFVEDESMLVNLANLYLMHGMPFKSAQLLDEQIKQSNIKSSVKNLRLLAQAWQQAKEDVNALKPLEKAAGKAPDGDLYVQLGRSFLNLKRWPDAEKSLKKALSKQSLSNVAKANMLLGIAQLNLKKYKPARKSFKNAEKDKKQKKVSQKWLAYIDYEIKRSEQITEHLNSKSQSQYFKSKEGSKMMELLNN